MRSSRPMCAAVLFHVVCRNWYAPPAPDDGFTASYCPLDSRCFTHSRNGGDDVFTVVDVVVDAVVDEVVVVCGTEVTLCKTDEGVTFDTCDSCVKFGSKVVEVVDDVGVTSEDDGSV